MDLAELQLKNLDIINSGEKASTTDKLRVARRSTAIQKDFFSMMEYLVWAVNQHLELDYYKTRKRKTQKREIAFFD